MRNLALTLRFDGGAFCGWQRQPNGFTVQQAMEDAVERVTGARAAVTGCSRTDAGVHAREYVCNFHTESALPCEKFLPALNFYLPAAVSVQACREAPAEFHARYSCIAKTYRYHIHNARVRDPFLLGRALLEPHPLDEAFLRGQAAHFLGAHDFTAFCAAHAGINPRGKGAVRTVTRFDVERAGDEVYFYVCADGFLYNMVRIMAGTLLETARGRLPEDSIPGILASKDRARAGYTAPAQGLWLWDVEYN